MTGLTRRDILGGAAALALMPSAAVASSPDFRSLGLARPAFEIDPKLDLTDLDGTRHRIGDYRGKVLAVSFWATWCPPCRREMPALARLARELGRDDFAVLAVNVGDREDRIRAFLDEIDDDGLTVLMDTGKTMPGIWYLRGLPVTYILNGSAEVILAAVGDRVWDAPEMVTALKELNRR
ncbi:TlpA disulfide reductase family protein [Roseibium sp.]|uniref:TlpA family protein disulfide reductase n=1 Tax=Roseibium sp. TaxID=1936156 RepID=UPI0032639697